jgi:hypothetical protein
MGHNLTHKETDLLALSAAIENSSFPLQHRAFVNSNISLAPNVKVLRLDFLEHWASTWRTTAYADYSPNGNRTQGLFTSTLLLYRLNETGYLSCHSNKAFRCVAGETSRS